MVLGAGEMTFVQAGADWRVAEVTNQSTGFCPDPDSWPAVAAALDSIDASSVVLDRLSDPALVGELTEAADLLAFYRTEPTTERR